MPSVIGRLPGRLVSISWIIQHVKVNLAGYILRAFYSATASYSFGIRGYTRGNWFAATSIRTAEI